MINLAVLVDQVLIEIPKSYGFIQNPLHYYAQILQLTPTGLINLQ